jgi:predicted kinase
VACLQHEQGVPGADRDARSLHALALRHLRKSRRVLVLVGGLPGSGKSTLASGLSATTGWTLLRSDQLRRTVSNSGRDRYAPEVVTAVYEELVSEARALLTHGQGVILDASWVDSAHRSLAVRAATETDSDLVQICCSCTDTVAASRILARLAREVDDSEATPAVRDLLARRFDPWPAATVLDTSDRTPAESLASALPALADPDPGAGTLVPHARHVPP